MDEASRHSLAALALLRAHAPGFCREAGVGFPESLLFAGLPRREEADDPPHDAMRDAPGRQPAPSIRTLDSSVDWWVNSHPDRKGAGLFLTPPSVARSLLGEASRDGWTPASVLDPAVGAGVFLLTARELFGPDIALYGVDRDPMAVAATRLALWIAGAETDPSILCARIRVADALEVSAASGGPPLGWLPVEGVDLVCGNPPFGNAIEKRTALSQSVRSAMARRFPEVARGPYDRSVLFVRLAGEWCSREGRIALLVPRVLLAADYAAGLRAWSERAAPLTGIRRFSRDLPCLDADVSMVGWIARKGSCGNVVLIAEAGPERGWDGRATRRPAPGASRAVGAAIPTGSAPPGAAIERAPRVVLREDLRNESWGALIDPLAARIEAVARTHPRLGEMCSVRSGSAVAEAYRIAGEIREGGEDEEGWRFLVSGTIARCGDRWGDRSSRHLGRRFNRPVLPREARSLSPARRGLYDSPKVIVCGLSRVLRAREDASGECAGSVGTFLVMPRWKGDGGGVILRRLSILLNSAWYSIVHRTRKGAAALSGGNLPLLRRDIEEFPLPAVFSTGDRLGHLDDLDPVRDDASAQRVVLELAGYGDEDAQAIIEAWTEWLEPRRRGREAIGGSPR